MILHNQKNNDTIRLANANYMQYRRTALKVFAYRMRRGEIFFCYKLAATNYRTGKDDNNSTPFKCKGQLRKIYKQIQEVKRNAKN